MELGDKYLTPSGDMLEIKEINTTYVKKGKSKLKKINVSISVNSEKVFSTNYNSLIKDIKLFKKL